MTIVRWGLVVIAAAVVAWEVRAAPGDPTPDSLRAGLVAAAKAIDAGQCDKALPLIREAIASPDFANAPDDLASFTWAMGTRCAVDQRHYEEGFRDALAATAYPNAEDWLWRVRWELGMQLYRPDSAIDTAELLVHIRPGVMSQVDARRIFLFDDKLRTSGATDMRRRLLAALDQADYRPPNPFDTADYIWLRYAGILADGGDAAGATRMLNRLDTAYFIIEARMDRRFAGAIALAPERFDPRRAAERQLARDQAAMETHPDLARGVSETADSLRLLGRAPEALALVNQALAKVARGNAAKPAFTDLDTRANWLLDERAMTLRDLGRFDEWVEALRQAAALKEDGGDNVSQVINLAEALVAVNRPDEALEALKPLGEAGEARPASPYGVIEMMSTRVCALAELGRSADIAVALAFMTSREADNAGALTDALLCADDLNGAAASYIRRLVGSDTRPKALWSLSDFTDQAPLAPRAREIDRRWRLVRDRPDVRAAIAAAGFVEVLPLRSGVF